MTERERRLLKIMSDIERTADWRFVYPDNERKEPSGVQVVLALSVVNRLKEALREAEAVGGERPQQMVDPLGVVHDRGHDCDLTGCREAEE